MSNATLRTLYASGGTEIRIATLSFRCDAWTDDVHLCKGHTDFTATLEDNSTVTFIAADFAAQLAKRAAEGNQSLQFALSPGESDALQRLDDAMSAAALVYVDYREYIKSDPTAPARPKDTLTVISYSYEEPTLSFNASFHDLTNKAWPRRRYTTKTTPGLTYYGS